MPLLNAPKSLRWVGRLRCTLRRTLVWVSLLVASCGAVADGLQVDQLIKLRRGAYALQGHYFSMLKPMATSVQPFDADQAMVLTARVEALSRMVPEFFPVGSGVGDTHAKSEIWDDHSDFLMRQQKLISELEQLSASARNSDFDRFKQSYFQAVDSCKSCHEIYRSR